MRKIIVLVLVIVMALFILTACDSGALLVGRWEPTAALGGASLVGQWETTLGPMVVLQEPPPPPPPPPPPGALWAVPVPNPPRTIAVPYHLVDDLKQEHPIYLEYEKIGTFERRIAYEFFSDGNGTLRGHNIIIEGNEGEFWYDTRGVAMVQNQTGDVELLITRNYCPYGLLSARQVTWSADGNRLLTQYYCRWENHQYPSRTRTFNVSGNTLTLGGLTFERVR